MSNKYYIHFYDVVTDKMVVIAQSFETYEDAQRVAQIFDELGHQTAIIKN